MHLKLKSLKKSRKLNMTNGATQSGLREYIGHCHCGPNEKSSSSQFICIIWQWLRTKTPVLSVESVVVDIWSSYGTRMAEKYALKKRLEYWIIRQIPERPALELSALSWVMRENTSALLRTKTVVRCWSHRVISSSFHTWKKLRN